MLLCSKLDVRTVKFALEMVLCWELRDGVMPKIHAQPLASPVFAHVRTTLVVCRLWKVGEAFNSSIVIGVAFNGPWDREF